jgi:hypothetical protein
MKKHITWVCFMAASLAVVAQNKSLAVGRVFGKILDKNTAVPVAYASVAVYVTANKKDSLIAGMLTRENGEFNITDLPFGKYKVRVSFVGFKDIQQLTTLAPPEVEQDLGNISLETDSKVLKTVDITAEKSTMQLAIDRKVFNMDKNLHAQGGTVADALKTIPSVTVDGDGGVLLRNQIPQIYIDGRPTPLSIQQIAADQIEQIEVITNPAARFDASTSGGIINLVLKKNNKTNLNGNYALGVGTGNRYAGMTNIGFKKNPFNVSLFLNFNSADFGVAGYSRRTNLSDSGADFLNQDNRNTIHNKLFSGRFAVDYMANIRNTFSFSTAVTLGNVWTNENQTFEGLNGQRLRSFYGTRTVLPDNPYSDFVFNGTWKRTFVKKGRELIANFTYNFGETNNDSEFKTFLFSTDGTPMYNEPQIQRNFGAINDKQTTFTLDYVTPINDSTKFEAGVRSFWNGRGNDFFADTLTAAKDYQSIDYLTFKYNFDNYINAAYINFIGKLKHNWSYQAGFRYEQSDFIGKSVDGQEDFSYAYPSDGNSILKTLFPSLYLNKKINATTEWQLNFSRKIGRPSFSQITPFINFSDKNSLRLGNIALRPEFINLAEINYNKTFGKVNLLTAVYFRSVDDPIVFYAYRETTDPSQLITTFVNADINRAMGIDNTVKWPLSKKAELTTNFNVFNLRFKYQNITNTGWAWNGKATLTIKLPKDINYQLTAYYETPMAIPQGTRGGMYFADMTIRKDIWNKTGTLSLILNDIFNSKKLFLNYETPQYLLDAMRRRDNRYVRLTLQKRFGKVDASVFKPRKPAVKSVREQSNNDDN